MVWTAIATAAITLYGVCYWLAAFYSTLAGGLPGDRWGSAIVLECFLVGIGFLAGVIWEKFQDEEGAEDPLRYAGFLAGVLITPILMHQLINALPVRLVNTTVLLVEKYRYEIALIVLAAGIFYEAILQWRYERDLRHADYIAPSR